MNKNQSLTNCNMAGGGFSGLTSQTLRPLSCGSDTPDYVQATINNESKHVGRAHSLK